MPAPAIGRENPVTDVTTLHFSSKQHWNTLFPFKNNTLTVTYILIITIYILSYVFVSFGRIVANLSPWQGCLHSETLLLCDQMERFHGRPKPKHVFAQKHSVFTLYRCAFCPLKTPHLLPGNSPSTSVTSPFLKDSP